MKGSMKNREPQSASNSSSSPPSPDKSVSSNSDRIDSEGKESVKVPVTYCPECHKRFKIKPASEGRKTRCPKCNAHFTINLKWLKPKTVNTQKSEQNSCVNCGYRFGLNEDRNVIDNESVCDSCKEALEKGEIVIIERDPLKKKLRRMEVMAPHIRRYLTSPFSDFLYGLWNGGGFYIFSPIGLGIIVAAFVMNTENISDRFILGFIGFTLISVCLRTFSRKRAIWASAKLSLEFPQLEDEVHQALTDMLDGYDSLPEDMVTFQAGRDKWEVKLGSEYAVCVCFGRSGFIGDSSGPVRFLARDEVKVKALDVEISKSDEEVNLNLQLGGEDIEGKMSTAGIKRLTKWLENK
jgi:hypothetical protein